MIYDEILTYKTRSRKLPAEIIISKSAHSLSPPFNGLSYYAITLIPLNLLQKKLNNSCPLYL
jgi:hypothetical protein